MTENRIAASYVYTLDAEEPIVNGYVEYDDDGQITYVPPVQVPVMKKEPLPKPVYERPGPSVEGRPAVSRKPLLLEEEKKKKHEKIDPKKLVIYSEIMKPKF